MNVGSSICMYTGLFALPSGSPAAAAAVANGSALAPAPAPEEEAPKEALELAPPRAASAPRRRVRMSALSSRRLVYTSACVRERAREQGWTKHSWLAWWNSFALRTAPTHAP